MNCAVGFARRGPGKIGGADASVVGAGGVGAAGTDRAAAADGVSNTEIASRVGFRGRR